MKYFEGVTTLDELKRQYRRLAVIHHPDVGGDLETMKAINDEHDLLFEHLKALQNAAATEDSTGRTHATTETPQEFRDIVSLLLRLDGLEVELCGSWLWIGGDTRRHKETLKAAGCRWSQGKGRWYWHHKEEGSHWHRGTKTMGQIRSKYGSQVFRPRGSQRLEEATA